MKIREALKKISSLKRKIALVFFIVTGCFVGSFFFIDKVYKSSAMLVVPMAGDALASLNLPIPSQQVSSEQISISEFIEVAESKSFIINFIEKNDLQPFLMAYKAYSPGTKQVLFDSSKYNVNGNKWSRSEILYKTKEPSNDELFDYFSNNVLRITGDKVTGIIEISFSYISPIHAKMWLEYYIDDLNSFFRERDIATYNKSIELAYDLLQGNEIASIKDFTNSFIEENHKNLITAKSKEEYVARYIDYPDLPDKPYFPSLPIFILFGLLFSSIISALITFKKEIKEIILS
jgi:uncharacterized protein involved in exopolysaccharide biosynthesis